MTLFGRTHIEYLERRDERERIRRAKEKEEREDAKNRRIRSQLDAMKLAPRLHHGVIENCSEMGQARPKGEKAKGGKGEDAHKAALATLGCMACRRIYGQHPPGPVELHHLRTGGWGKGDYLTLIPLCVEHHRGKSGVHGLGTKGFPKHYGFDQADLLADALALIDQLGAKA